MNQDDKTVSGFSDEWTRFDQSNLSSQEHQEIFDKYFRIFPWNQLPQNAVGMDVGCGSGRWAKLVAPRAGRLYCIDPSRDALEVSRRNLKHLQNVEFMEASVDQIDLQENSLDFAYSLGVLHHVPDTQKGIDACVAKLKPGAPFLVYLYYAFDNKPIWFKWIWRLSDLLRRGVSKLPMDLRYVVSQMIAVFIYYPLARFAKLIEKLGGNLQNFPLSFYRHTSFYVMRTDALDRFGTRLEQRFSKKQIQTMLAKAGLTQIQFNSTEPYWCAVGIKANNQG